MAALPYIQLYVADYLADTQHLSLEEHGAYLLLIFCYWQRGKPLEDNDQRLSSICSTDVQRWLGIRSTVEEFFDIKDGLWVHHRVENDLLKVHKKSLQAQKAGKASAAARAVNTDTPSGRSTDVQRGGQRGANHTRSRDTEADTDIKKKSSKRKVFRKPDFKTPQPTPLSKKEKQLQEIEILINKKHQAPQELQSKYSRTGEEWPEFLSRLWAMKRKIRGMLK